MEAAVQGALEIVSRSGEEVTVLELMRSLSFGDSERIESLIDSASETSGISLCRRYLCTGRTELTEPMRLTLRLFDSKDEALRLASDLRDSCVSLYSVRPPALSDVLMPMKKRTYFRLSTGLVVRDRQVLSRADSVASFRAAHDASEDALSAAASFQQLNTSASQRDGWEWASGSSPKLPAAVVASTPLTVAACEGPVCEPVPFGDSTPQLVLQDNDDAPAAEALEVPPSFADTAPLRALDENRLDEKRAVDRSASASCDIVVLSRQAPSEASVTEVPHPNPLDPPPVGSVPLPPKASVLPSAFDLMRKAQLADSSKLGQKRARPEGTDAAKGSKSQRTETSEGGREQARPRRSRREGAKHTPVVLAAADQSTDGKAIPRLTGLIDVEDDDAELPLREDIREEEGPHEFTSQASDEIFVPAFDASLFSSTAGTGGAELVVPPARQRSAKSSTVVDDTSPAAKPPRAHRAVPASQALITTFMNPHLLDLHRQYERFMDTVEEKVGDEYIFRDVPRFRHRTSGAVIRVEEFEAKEREAIKQSPSPAAAPTVARQLIPRSDSSPAAEAAGKHPPEPDSTKTSKPRRQSKPETKMTTPTMASFLAAHAQQKPET